MGYEGPGTPRRRDLQRFLSGWVAAALVGAACSAAGVSDASLTVYATTGYLADAVVNIAPEARVTTMVGPGGDPHTYQPSTRDIETMRGADVVLWNGLHLEAQMRDQLLSLGERQLAVGEGIPTGMLLELPSSNGAPLYDPHIWNSPEIWARVVDAVTAKLSAADPANAAEYRANATRYLEAITTATADAERMLSALPAEPRILISGHDAFGYFGATYGLEVHATDFISTEAALSPRELSDLAGLIAENRVPVIFQDNQANPQAITSLREAVAALGWDVTVSGEQLYADSLGAEPGVDTYVGVFLHNARTVADALSGADGVE